MGKRADKYQLDCRIPRIEIHESTHLINAVKLHETTRYVQALREGLIGHLDKVVWNIRTFPDNQRNKLIKMYKELYSHAQVKDYTHQTYRWKHGRFLRQTQITSYPFRLLINWRRDQGRQYFSPYDGGIESTWERKEDYSGYHEYLKQVEDIMSLCGLEWSLGYVEISQDTVSPEIGAYVFRHVVLSKGNHNQIMWFDHDSHTMKAGTNRQADNHYQNNEHSVKQLSCHKKSRTEDYFDDILRSHIWRCELRIKRAVSRNMEAL